MRKKRSSRIFIKNLPQARFTEDDFREHFEKFAPITDVKFIPNRRIGYVGFKTSENAEKAVKFFNKSFIRMSRIAVEIARPVADDSLPRPWSAHTPGSSAYQRRHEPKLQGHDTSKLRRPDIEVTCPPKDTKLREFLEVMQPFSRANTWTNGETGISNHDDSPSVQIEEDESDEEFIEIKTKPKKPLEETVGNYPSVSIGENSDAIIRGLPKERTVDEKAAEVTGNQNLLLTDREWLRSKTNRLLDLTDDVEPHFAQMTTEAECLKSTTDHTIATPINTHQGSAVLGDDGDIEMEGMEESANFNTTMQEINKTGRLFLRNLPYTATEEDLWSVFEPYGGVGEVHLVLDNKTNQSKGFAFILYNSPSDAVEAYKAMDKSIFQGRILHIMAGVAKREHKLDEFDVAKLPLKRQLELKKKSTATTPFNWNSMYMNIDAVMSSMAERLGVPKSEILDPTSSDTAVKQAHAETQIIQETKQYLKDNGVNLEAFRKNVRYSQKSDKIILVKNFPYGTKREELTKMFGNFGDIRRILMPPAGTIAIIEFVQAPAARAAYANVAYRRFKNTVLFLEKGPKDLFDSDFLPADSDVTATTSDAKTPKVSVQELLQPDESEEIDTTTLYVRNLNFSTTSAGLSRVFSAIDGFRKATVKIKSDPKRPEGTLSMGFGFVEFGTKAQAHAAMTAMDGYTLDGHQLLVKASHQSADVAAERRREDLAKKITANKTKVILKNLPFEATEKDVRRLVTPYGKLRAIRLPKKFGTRSSGFAFAEFVSAKEAFAAMETLKNTHFLGRRLVLEWSNQDAVSAEEEIELMHKKAGRQSSLMATQALREINKRRKVNLKPDEE